MGQTSNLLKNKQIRIENSGNLSFVNNDFEKVKNLLRPFYSVYKFEQFEKSEFLFNL